jgi:hypothetical protein
MSHPIKLIIACLTFNFAMSLATPAAAQGVFDMGALTNTISTSANTQAEQKRAGQAVAVPSQSSIAALNYKLSLDLRRQNIAKFVEGMKGMNPEAGAQMEQAFAQVDIIDEVGKGIAKYGLKTSNIADAYTVYLMTAWMTANGRMDDNSNEQVAGTKQMAVNALTASPDVGKLSDADKQAFAESLLIQAMLFEATLGSVAADPAQMAKVQGDIRTGAKAMGIDVDLFKLTPTGLIRK